MTKHDENKFSGRRHSFGGLGGSKHMSSRRTSLPNYLAPISEAAKERLVNRIATILASEHPGVTADDLLINKIISLAGYSPLEELSHSKAVEQSFQKALKDVKASEKKKVGLLTNDDWLTIAKGISQGAIVKNIASQLAKYPSKQGASSKASRNVGSALIKLLALRDRALGDKNVLLGKTLKHRGREAGNTIRGNVAALLSKIVRNEKMRESLKTKSSEYFQKKEKAMAKIERIKNISKLLNNASTKKMVNEAIKENNASLVKKVRDGVIGISDARKIMRKVNSYNVIKPAIIEHLARRNVEVPSMLSSALEKRIMETVKAVTTEQIKDVQEKDMSKAIAKEIGAEDASKSASKKKGDGKKSSASKGKKQDKSASKKGGAGALNANLFANIQDEQFKDLKLSDIGFAKKAMRFIAANSDRKQLAKYKKEFTTEFKQAKAVLKKSHAGNNTKPTKSEIAGLFNEVADKFVGRPSPTSVDKILGFDKEWALRARAAKSAHSSLFKGHAAKVWSAFKKNLLDSNAKKDKRNAKKNNPDSIKLQNAFVQSVYDAIQKKETQGHKAPPVSDVVREASRKSSHGSLSHRESSASAVAREVSRRSSHSSISKGR